MKITVKKVGKQKQYQFCGSNYPELKAGETLFCHFGLCPNGAKGAINDVVSANGTKWTVAYTEGNPKTKWLQMPWGKKNDGQQILRKVNKLRERLFTSEELSVLSPVNVATNSKNPEGKGELLNAFCWVPEIEEYEKDLKRTNYLMRSSGTRNIWTRSYAKDSELPDEVNGKAYAVKLEDGEVRTQEVTVNEKLTVIPTYSIDLENVILAKNWKSDNTWITKNEGQYNPPKEDCRLLISCESYNSWFEVEPICDHAINNQLKFVYSGVSITGQDECGKRETCISAVLSDRNGKISHYWNVLTCLYMDAIYLDASGTLMVVLPEDVKPGDYTLALFVEERHGQYCTDYASVPYWFEISVSKEDDEEDSCPDGKYMLITSQSTGEIETECFATRENAYNAMEESFEDVIDAYHPRNSNYTKQISETEAKIFFPSVQATYSWKIVRI